MKRKGNQRDDTRELTGRQGKKHTERISAKSSSERARRTKRVRRRKAPETIYNPDEVMRTITRTIKTRLFFAIAAMAFVLLIVSTAATSVVPNPEVIPSGLSQDNWFDDTDARLLNRGKSTMGRFPFGCVSNQQCIMDSMAMMDKGLMNAPLPYCWKNGECRGERQLVMQLSVPSDTRGNKSALAAVPHQATPFPVFHQGEEMCVTIMFNPSLVLLDDLWPSGNEDEGMRDEASLQQERLLLFQSIPLRITLSRMWMCSSRKNLRLRPNTAATPMGSMLPNLVDAFSSRNERDEQQQDVVCVGPSLVFPARSVSPPKSLALQTYLA
jgi:hypothetical protein